MVPVQIMCPICQKSEETIFYALISYSIAAQCWQRLLAGVRSIVAAKFYSWFDQILQRYSKGKCREAVMLCWGLWKARNKLVWNQKYATVDGVLISSMSCLVQWNSAQNRGSKASFPVFKAGDRVEFWVKPQENTIKVTVDAAIFHDRATFGYDIVALRLLRGRSDG
ncbi:hypothetical protein CsatB_008587 [Cannabis sativa]